MKRFYDEHSKGWPKQLASASLFLAFFLAFLLGLSGISRETGEKQAESLKLSISRGIAHCYATEGHYPETLDDLKQHYGIHYDADRFFVDYQVLGENIFPDVTIIEK